jgi:heat shock protein HslJ
MNRFAFSCLPLLAALSLAACATAGGTSAAPLVGTTWQHGADGPQAAHILLDEKAARVIGFGGCNRLTGRYTLSGSALSFDGVASTRRACLDDDGSEDRFLAALSGVRGWRIEAGRLQLLSAGGGTLLELRPAPASVPVPR